MIILLLIFQIPLVFASNGKEDVFVRKNKFGVEIGGSSLIMSTKYERILLNYNRHKTAVELGVGLLSLNTGINQLISFHQHHVELKMGALGTRMIYSDSIYYSFGVGYRFQKSHGRTAFQISCPINYGKNSGYFVNVGVSISRVF
ncbi:hypothetical protein [Alkalitalea saponilacus]|nr:hypothetical protein [Alkalitalea saponilacus]ASB50724.1 hypothetical protein CDL62_16995 [Alkalitalea saponilacus]